MPDPIPSLQPRQESTRPRPELVSTGEFADGRSREQSIEHNKEILAQDVLLGPTYQLCYEAALEQFPELGDVAILAKSGSSHSPGSARSRYAANNTTGRHQMGVNMVPGTVESVLVQLEQRPSTKKIFMDYLGITDPAKLTPKRIMAHIFLHELGHTLDYIRLIDSPEAHKRFKKRREEEGAIHLPIPGVKTGQLLDPEYQAKLLALNPDLFERMKVSGFSELASKQEIGYRHMPTEVFADSFAAAILKREKFTLTSSAEL